MAALSEFLASHENVRRGGDGFVMRCRAHEDKSNSLSAKQADGKILVHCFAGCETEAIVAAIGWQLKDLFVEPKPNGPRLVRRSRSTSTSYQIKDSAGELVAIHERIPTANGKSFTWRRSDGSAGLNGTPLDRVPLYLSQFVSAWDIDKPVVVTEGEGAADAVVAAELQAVGTVTGAAATPGDDALAVLTGCDVVLWPDADDAGRAHMERIAALVRPRAARLRVVSWLDAPDKGDAADTTPERIRELVAASVPYDEPQDAAAVTWRTLADVDDAPPGELLLGILEPDGPNLLNAAGGTGKGTTGAWMIRELLTDGMRPMIYDAENRPKEWARRTSGLGVDRSRVVYVQPSDLPRSMLGRPLWDTASHLGTVAKASGADALFVDSILAAVGVGEERLKSDAQAPYLYVAALDALGIPSVSFSHPPKGQPDGDPFGSVAWTNAMRLTWQGTTGEGAGHRVRWRPRKRNERGHIAGVLLIFSYGLDGRLADVTREDDDESTRDWILAGLTGGPRTVAQLAEEQLDALPEPPNPELARRTEERLGRAMRRMAGEQWVEKIGKAGRSDLWALRVRGEQ